MAAMWGGSGDPRWDPDGLEAGLQVSEVSGEGAPVGLWEEAGETVGELGAGRSGGVGEVEVEEASRSGRFWLDERRLLLPSLSPAAIFLLSLRG